MGNEVVTLNVEYSKGKTRPYSVVTTNKSFINSIVTVREGNIITEEDYKTIEAAKAKAGDVSVLEYVDLTPQEITKMANMTSKYSRKYDIKLDDKQQYYEVTIKDHKLHEWLGVFGGPARKLTASDIKDDFNLQNKYPHADTWGNNKGNTSALTKYNPGLCDDYGCITEDKNFEAGTTFKLPVNDVTFDF